eukprot:GHVP01003833.1.p1 GENE.GHVP01003833.1~~GHVP01003833.1.p1  ORF type:complete len:215 (+),score=51.09 GHVP01003833.1:896-1540(+)
MEKNLVKCTGKRVALKEEVWKKSLEGISIEDFEFAEGISNEGSLDGSQNSHTLVRYKIRGTISPFNVGSYKKIEEEIKMGLRRDILLHTIEKKKGAIIGVDKHTISIDKTGIITGESSFLVVNLEATFLLFVPEVGDVLIGSVSVQKEKFILLHILNYFCAIIQIDEICGLTWENGQWKGESKSVREGASIAFKVMDVTIEDGILQIKGSLKDD